MKNILLLLMLNSAFICAQNIHVPVDTIVKTFHETTIKGKKIKNPTIVGLTQGKSVVWVWRGKNFKISRSSLAHELVHVSLRALNGHGDYDHEGPIKEGWTSEHTELIIDVNRAIEAFVL